MTSEFSPTLRKAIALLILLVFTVGGVELLAYPLITLTGEQLDRLADSRFHLTRLDAVRLGPEPPRESTISPTLYIHAANRADAITQLTAKLSGLAASYQLGFQPASTAGRPSRDDCVSLRFTAEGTEAAVLNFIRAAEQAEPLIRFEEWKVVPTEVDAGHLRLTATATSVWDRR